MDEVRIWRTERSQEDILAHMRDASGLENHPDLAAYWKFDDPQLDGIFTAALKARDSSGRGNDLPLVTLPVASRQRVERVGGARALHLQPGPMSLMPASQLHPTLLWL